ncbi:hypothetical protein BP5796_00629 [Coleophoma crateriformis]|uniref:Uncharacterized protein n=1 Tax=Coleophoma crateriformis TaxID=565419 RepID=A0A3D8T8J5_9HELO|nr:hypothetical protein BP5796_00629 [Coleophoma crateriformis]
MEAKAYALVSKYCDEYSKLSQRRSLEDTGLHQERQAIVNSIKALESKPDKQFTPVSDSDRMAIDPLTKDAGVAEVMAESSSTQATPNKSDYHLNILTKAWKDDDDQKNSGRGKEDSTRIANLVAALLELEYGHGTIADLLPHAPHVPLAASKKRTADGEKKPSRAKKDGASKPRKSRGSTKTTDDEAFHLSLTPGSKGKGKEVAREEPSRPIMPLKVRLHTSGQEISEEEMDDEPAPPMTDFELRRQANIKANNKAMAEIAPLEFVPPKKPAVPRPRAPKQPTPRRESLTRPAKESAMVKLALGTQDMEESPEEDFNEPEPMGKEPETEAPEEDFDEPAPKRQEMETEDQFDFKPAPSSDLL